MGGNVSEWTNDYYDIQIHRGAAMLILQDHNQEIAMLFAVLVGLWAHAPNCA